MFERSPKAAHPMKRLTAVAAIPALFVLALLWICLTTPEVANAMYAAADPVPTQADERSGSVFLTDGASGLVSCASDEEVELSDGLYVNVSYQGQQYVTHSYAESLAHLLERMGIQPSPLEMIAVSFPDGGAEVEISSEFVFYEQISNVSEHEIEYRYNSRRPDWYEAVIQEGCDGEYTEVYEIIYQDGQRVARQLIDMVDVEPVPTIIEKGTMENFANNDDEVSGISVNEDGSGVITLANGETVTFSSTRTMRGTAYTTGGSVGSRTASGTQVRVGVVAVDRNVLPLGTKVYVMSNDGVYNYGFAVAEDTGVRGNTIDLYMNSNGECIQFGVRECTVYILD